jgi:hypothetical protein
MRNRILLGAAVALFFVACQQEQNKMASGLQVAPESNANLRGDDLPKSIRLADFSGKTAAEINKMIGHQLKAEELKDYSQEGLTAYIKKNSEKEAQRIAALGAGQVERIGDQLKIKLNNRMLTLKNELGEDIAEGLSNSTFHEFLAFFKEDNVIMVLTTTTGENVKDGFLAEYTFYDGSTGKKIMAQRASYPSIAPDGKTAVVLQKDEKGAVLSFLTNKEGNWKTQNINLSFNKDKKFDEIAWQGNDTLLIQKCEKDAQSKPIQCQKLGHAYYANGRWFRE